jgi:hypothetical protein
MVSIRTSNISPLPTKERDFVIKKQQTIKKKKAKLQTPNANKSKVKRTSSVYANDLTAPSTSSGPGANLPPRPGKT